MGHTAVYALVGVVVLTLVGSGSAVSLDIGLQTPLAAAAESPALPEESPLALVEWAGSDRAAVQRVATVLQKVGKTLILAHTRGSKGVAIYRKAVPAVVLVVTDEGLGSGAIINAEGHVVTNWHVVGTAPQVIVVFKPKDGTELKKELAFRATVEKVDQVTDLALLKIHAPPQTMAFLSLGNISTLQVGQDVHAIGHPKGEVWTYTQGIISQIRADYAWSTGAARSHRAKVIQTQTPVNPGNSGGPLLDDKGKLIGINAFRGHGEGLNYAVAVDEIHTFLTREGSRVLTAQQPPAMAAGKPQCTETYDTTGQGWPDIRGCYTAASVPPPDLWLVYRNPQGPLAYGALDSSATGKIDVAILLAIYRQHARNSRLPWSRPACLRINQGSLRALLSLRACTWNGSSIPRHSSTSLQLSPILQT